MATGECTPKKRAPSTLLRVTYFDDFDLFRSQQPPTTEESNKRLPLNEASKSGNNKSSSANDLDTCPLPRASTTAAAVPVPSKTHSLDKPYHRSIQQQLLKTSLSGEEVTGGGIPRGVYGVSTGCVSSSTEEEEGFQSLEGQKDSRSSSTTTSIALVSCCSRVNEEERSEAAEEGQEQEEDERQMHLGRNYQKQLPYSAGHVDCCEDISSSSVASSSATLKSSFDQPLSDYQSPLSPPGLQPDSGSENKQ